MGVFCFAMFGIGFIYNWPTTLALCSRVAPPALGGVIMGVPAFLTGAVANNLSGVIGSYYEKMTPQAFWLMHAGIAASGALLVLVFYRPLARILYSKAARDGTG